MQPKTEKSSRLIQSVGMKTFVKYYDYFKNDYSTEEMMGIFEEDWKLESAKSKITKGKTIFRENRTKDVLEKIIKSNPNRIGTETIQKAKELLIQL